MVQIEKKYAIDSQIFVFLVSLTLNQNFAKENQMATFWIYKFLVANTFVAAERQWPRDSRRKHA